MTIRFILPALLVLAACSDSRAAGDGAPPKAGSEPPPASTASEPAARKEGDLPDWGDPRLFVNMDSLRWSQWEAPVKGDRLARLRALGIVPLRTDSTGPREPIDLDLGSYDPGGERAIDFHFLDFSGDGVDDVIYDGGWFERNDSGSVGGAEGTQLKLFQVMDGRAVQVMNYHASIQRIWKGAAGQPLSFRTAHRGCCGEVHWELDYFRPAPRGDTVRFEPYHHVLGGEEMQLPTRFLPAPRRFTVNNDGYALRSSPQILDAAQTEDQFPAWEGHGNVVAEYGRGARGTAIAEQADSTGRMWWFVRMDGATPPATAQMDVPYIDDRPVPADRLGWMSSRFVTVQP